MKEGFINPKLIGEEKKAIKLFLWLFYIFFYTYDIFWYYILPKYFHSGGLQHLKDGLGLWVYLLTFFLLPLSMLLIKRDNPYVVKYLIIIGYVLIDTVDKLLKFNGSAKHFASGNIVELLFLFFTPIFVNKKYFWTVSIAIIGKYLLLGFALHTTVVAAPIGITLVLAAIGFIVLTRFNSYLTTIKSVYDELRENERLVLIGQMATAIGHEIRNPLSSLKGFIQLQKESYPNTNDHYPIMVEEVDRINSIVNDLMFLGKPRVIKFEKVRVEEILAYTLSITQQQAERNGILVNTIIEEDLSPIEGDEKQLKQVFINLIKNAIEAMIEGGNINIRVEVINRNFIRVTIKDEGPGIKEKDLINLGKPFFTTKEDGTGLGLMVTKQIINDHKGELNIESVVGRGTTVQLNLPLLQ